MMTFDNDERIYVFTIVSYLIGVFIFATIVGQVGNVITNRNANRLEFERLLDGAKTYMRHHKVPGGMKRRVLRWYDYSWSRGRIQGGGDINTALGLLPDKLKTELALHVNLSVLKKVTIFQECQPEFLHDLVLKMKAYIFTPGDSICRKGEVAREMFIIADGILEVLSETGRVLTTMKAGDFFGEIGILNLDGLNKRTADVRSVGDSELFSLSREDVLAAMKDYPEAQEILQTLGRKRLMEVRCINKKHAAKKEKDAALAEAAANALQGQDSSDNSGTKRIVDKFKNDVKGLKNALKKTRKFCLNRANTHRRSDESIELQPLKGSGSKTPKGVLRRMQRVKSDELNADDEECPKDEKKEEKITSPIGAGLPLLQRLRLLKEKQDREERAAKHTTVVSPPHTHVSSTISPQASIQEEPEAEVIGAGLPLLQRLKMLKAKEEKLKQSKDSQSSRLSVSSQGSYTRKSSVSPTSPTVRTCTPTVHEPGISRTNLKVSFKDRIKNLQKESGKEEKSGSTESNDAKQHLLPSTSAVKHKKPSTAQQFKDKIRSFSHMPKDELTPWSKLKLATVVSLGGSYSSLNNSITGDSPKLSKTTLKSSMPIDLNTFNKHDESNALGNEFLNLKPEQKTSVSDSEIKNETANISVKIKRKPKPFRLISEPKKYRSVDDLSPEYSGLPFVKKLKILNERQKLAELESAIQTRSFSLDCTDSSNSNEMVEVLTRSQSEASCMVTRPRVNLLSSPVVPVAPLNFYSYAPPIKSPLSPESNETLERKQLKSILKRLSEDRLTQNVNVKGDARPDMKRLMRAQTLEGYVARRTKFTKSVTFNNTLSSPPNSSTLTEEPEESFKSSPPLSSTPIASQAIYPISNAQDSSKFLDSSQTFLTNRTNVDESTNRFNFPNEFVALTSEETMIQASENTPMTPNPSIDDPSRRYSFVSDECGQRKIVKVYHTKAFLQLNNLNLSKKALKY
ncbi:CLUMA_CG012186, isoform A [Clunio marinus]|uniref:CLUMA_CG012186, isoform A n=1 Tax=Clunio marinus TaxID=568069 RepID=A0A1J1IFJ6_9DIPT|nr:CLUMA_CG012186, isoform A [Clunio marinus]